jgi:hypothetical protein
LAGQVVLWLRRDGTLIGVTDGVDDCHDIDRVAIGAGLLIAIGCCFFQLVCAFFALSFLPSPVASHTSSSPFVPLVVNHR